MIAGSLKLFNKTGEAKKASSVSENDQLQCVELDTYCYQWYKIRPPILTEGKIYNLNFAGGTLRCTFDQLVLCTHKKILPVGEALINKIKIHTCSGLCLPHSIENGSSKTVIVDIKAVGRNNRALVVESVYLM